MNLELLSFDLEIAEATRDEVALSAIRVLADIWHRRMGHINSQSLRILRDAGDNGIKYNDNMSPCDMCAFGKSKQQRHPKTTTHTTDRPFKLVYTDFLGPASPPALGGFRYVSKFTDQHSKWTEVFLIKEKSDAVSSLQTFVQTVVIPRGLRIERLRTDRGGEYTAGYFEQYCLDTGICHEIAATNTPQQNGVSERDGRTIANIARCLLKEAGFPKSLWGEMFFTATYLANRMPHSALQSQAPFTVLFGVPAKLDHLRTIGARAFVHVETHTSKLEDKAWEGRLCGYSMNSKAYRIYSNKTGRVTESRNVIFIETPASTLADSTQGNTTGEAVSNHEDSSPAENTDDICITHSEEIDSLLKKLSKLTSRNMDHAQSAGAEEPAAESADSNHILETTQRGPLPTDNELEGATRMGTRASGALTPVSHEGLNPHQQRELRNLGLLTSPMVSDAEVAHEKESTMEYALVGETEHRSDGAQEHRMEVYLDYALDTGNPVCEHSSDGEVITIPNTFK